MYFFNKIFFLNPSILLVCLLPSFLILLPRQRNFKFEINLQISFLSIILSAQTNGQLPCVFRTGLWMKKSRLPCQKTKDVGPSSHQPLQRPQLCTLRGFRIGKTKKQNRILGQDSWGAYQRNDFNEPRLLHLPIYRKTLNSLRCLVSLFSFFLLFILFLAVLGPHCCTQAFSSCGERGSLFAVACGLLIAMAFVAEHVLQERGLSHCGLRTLERRLSSCGARAQFLHGM